jgi:DNA polymerase I-like protein with 3'-5' exonuclease and polymerase domains
MDVYTIDLETYYAKDYSLTKLTTEQYVNDARFEVIGLAIKKNSGATQWYSGDEVAEFLAGFDFSGSLIVCHNTMFDGSILGWRYGVKPKLWADTMSMARFAHGVHESASLAALAKKYELGVKGTEVINALGKRRQDFTPEDLARYGEYCVNDVELTYDLFMELVPQVPKIELKLIDMTLRMFIEPVLEIDRGVLHRRYREVIEEKKAMLDSLKGDLNVSTTEEVREILASNPKFTELLESRGVEVPMKPSPTNPEKMIPALGKKDEGFIELQESEDDFVQLLCGIRLNTKSTMEQGRIENFTQIAIRNAEKLPIPLNYCGAHTGRWSGKEKINLQNLPSRDPKKKALKNSITAPPGHVVINCDSSQIEARVVAWWAGQDDLLEAFRNKQDVYRLMGSRIYNKKPEDITKEERFLAKTVVLGCGFGTGWKKLQSELNANGVKLPDDECKKIIHIYRESNFSIVGLWQQADWALREMLFGRACDIGVDYSTAVFDGSGIVLPNGYKIRYPELHAREVAGKPKFFYKSRKGIEGIWFGTLVENAVQGLARCVVAEQMLLISKRYRPVLTVHDAAVIVAPEEEKDEAVAFIEKCMSFVPDWADGLPVACESGVDFSYGGT